MGRIAKKKGWGKKEKKINEGGKQATTNGSSQNSFFYVSVGL